MYNEGMTIGKKRVYVDASVVGGMFDGASKRRRQTQTFWDAVRNGEIVIIVSDILDREVQRAPLHIRKFFATLPESQIERIVSTDESDGLAAQYIGSKIVSEKNLNDCKHIALATIARADAIVSWNCKHMVNEQRIPKYNDVNEEQGYPKIEILTPNKFMEAKHGGT
jgi:predicted nucleic acid-binding protein